MNDGDTSALTPAQMAARLAAALGDAMPGVRDLVVGDLVRTSTGLSRENWIFEARWRDADGARAQRMILRRDPKASLLNTDRAREFRVLRALAGSPVPAPAARWVDVEGLVLGAPALVMDLLPGECDWFVLNSSRPLATRLRLAEDFMGLLAGLQRVDWRTRGLDDGPPDTAYGAPAEIAFWEAELRRVQIEPLPEMELVLGWLRAHAPAPQGVVLVHGDFKPGNTLLVDDAYSALLDWETAHPGDPLEDLGWMTNPVRAREQQIADHWERTHMVAAFERLTGWHVDPFALTWWNVFANWKLAAIVLSGVEAFAHGTLDRIYHAPSFLYQNMFDMIESA